METKIYLIPSIFIYVIGIIILTILGKRKHLTIESFSIGTKTVNPIMVGLSLAVGMTSAATFVINPGLVYLYGFSGFLGYGVAAPLGIFLALIFMSKKFLKIGESSKVLTVPQWIGERYQSKSFMIFFAFLSFLQITFAVLITVGITIVIANSLELRYELVLALVLIFSIGYLMFGGGVNVLLFSNTLQAIFMIITAILFLISGPLLRGFNPVTLFTKLKEIDPNLVSIVNPKSQLFRDLFEVFVANFLVGIAIICQPHIISKALYLKSERDLNKYLTTVVIVGSLFFLVLFTGLYARVLLEGEILKPDQSISKYINTLFPPFALAVVTLGILSAGFSTLDNIMVVLSSIFSVNILKEFLLRLKIFDDEDKLKKFLLISSKPFLIILALIIYFLSLDQIYNPKLSVAIFAQNGVYGLFVTTFWPIFLGLFNLKFPKPAVLIASLIALLTHFGFYYFQITKYHNNPGMTAALALLLSGFFVLLVLIFNRGKK